MSEYLGKRFEMMRELFREKTIFLSLSRVNFPLARQFSTLIGKPREARFADEGKTSHAVCFEISLKTVVDL